IIAHEWVLELFSGQPALAAKTVVCPCGIDASFWKPSADRGDRRNAVVYWKSGDRGFCEQVEEIVRGCGLEPVRMRAQPGEHAAFSADDFRRALDRSAVAIFLSAFETQGLALAESWSMDVPAVVWDPQSSAQWRGRTFQARSSAPYLTPLTGRR